MKLTLRTLLAYLDDRLSPANAKELGQKLAKSPFATELADRIRNVVRRRRLARESAQQKTIDANLIAEYLDDQLTPELVALIEKEILSSDHSLAEVAATHQILGLLSDPVEIEGSLKERLYQLDPAAAGQAEAENGTAAGDSTSAEWQPLQRTTESQKRSPMILLVVMVIGWLALLATDSNLFQNRATLPAPADDGNLVADADTGPKINSPDGVPGNVKPQENDNEQKPPVTVADNTKPGEAETSTGPDGTEIVSVPDNTNTKPEGTETEPNTGETTVAATEGNEAGTKPDPEAGADNDPDKPPKFKVELIDENEMLVLQDADHSSWIWAAGPARDAATDWTAVLAGRFAAVPDPFRVRITAPNNGWTAEVLGPAVFSVTEGEVPGLHVPEGRVLLTKYPGDNQSPFRLNAGRQVMDFPVLSDEDVIGIEVIPLPISPVQPAAGGNLPDILPLSNTCSVAVTTSDSAVDILIQNTEQPVQVPAGSEWRWNTGSDLTTEGAQSLAAAKAEWVFDHGTPPTDLTAKLVAETATGFDRTISVTGAAAKLTENRNPAVAGYAVRLLTLIRSINDLTSLMKSPEQSNRTEAISGLRKIANESAVGAEQILTVLGQRLPEMEVDNAMKLIAGITRSEAEDPQTSAWLVGILSNNRISIRELAIYNLEQLTQKRHGYFAGDDAGRRDSAVSRWKRFLDQNDGRLLTPTE